MKIKLFWVIPSLVLGALILQAFATGRIIYYGLLGLIVLVFLLWHLARKNPQAVWVQVLYGFRGVRTDTAHMTKSELYLSGFQLLKWSIIFLAATVIAMYLLRYWKTMVLVMPIFIIGMFFLMCFFGGLYLLVRGVFRKGNYIPPDYIKNYPGDKFGGNDT